MRGMTTTWPWITLITWTLLAAALAGCSQGPTPKAIKSFPAAAGRALGEAAMQELPEGVHVLVIGRWEADQERHPLAHAFAEAFDERLQQTSGHVSVVNIPVFEDEEYVSHVHPGKLAAVLEAHEDVGGLVFFSVSPMRASKDWPPVFMMTPPDCRQEEDPLPSYARAVVCYRDGIDWTAQPDARASAEELFQQRYVLRRAP
jgi:hypothetical protein